MVTFNKQLEYSHNSELKSAYTILRLYDISFCNLQSFGDTLLHQSFYQIQT